MDRWDWMVVKAYVPTAFTLLVALIASWVVSGWQDNLFLMGISSVARWVPLAALAFAVGHGSWMTYRLWRAERGEGLLCECGGLLGHERPGVRGRGDYRKCLACGRNINHQHYE